MDARPQSFGDVLKQRREDAGLTQEALGAVANVSAGTISNLERGVGHRPHIETVNALAKALGLTGKELAEFRAKARPTAEAATPPVVQARSSAAPYVPDAARPGLGTGEGGATRRRPLASPPTGWVLVGAVGGVAAVVAIAVVIVLRTSGPAVGCTKEACNGQDPGTSGCSARSSTVEKVDARNAAGQVVGWIDLRWSELCQTNWARAQNTTEQQDVPLRVYLRGEDGRVLGPTVFSGQTKGIYGNMWYAPTGVIRVQACGTVGDAPEVCTKLS